MDGLPDFVMFESNGDGTGNKMDIKPLTPVHVGDYQIEFSVTDTDSERSGSVLTTTESFDIIVTGNTTDGATSSFDYSSLWGSAKTSDAVPFPQILEISASGLIRVHWQ